MILIMLSESGAAPRLSDTIRILRAATGLSKQKIMQKIGNIPHDLGSSGIRPFKNDLSDKREAVKSLWATFFEI